MTRDLGERLDQSFGEGPPPRPLEDHLVAGRAVVRRRRRLATVGTAAALILLGFGPVLLRPATGAGGGIDGPTPVPTPTTTEAPTPVHLLVAPARFIRPDTPPVLYLYGRMFKRARDVTVLGTYGEIDVSAHPQGAAIVRVGGRTLWVVVVGNEPERLVVEREAPYNYQAFMGWAQVEFPILSGRLALAATAPGPYQQPVSDDDSPAGFAGNLLVAKPGGTVVQRIHDPLANAQAVPPCHAQAVQVHTRDGDWFVVGFDCRGVGAVYSERVGVRATTLSAWLARVKKVQDAFVG